MEHSLFERKDNMFKKIKIIILEELAGTIDIPLGLSVSEQLEYCTNNFPSETTHLSKKITEILDLNSEKIGYSTMAIKAYRDTEHVELIKFNNDNMQAFLSKIGYTESAIEAIKTQCAFLSAEQFKTRWCVIEKSLLEHKILSIRSVNTESDAKAHALVLVNRLGLGLFNSWESYVSWIASNKSQNIEKEILIIEENTEEGRA